MKKFLFLIFILLAGAVAIYKLDIRPEVKSVVKQVKLNDDSAVTTKENLTPNAPPSQNAPK